MDGTEGFALLRVIHTCGHAVVHPVPTPLTDPKREQITAQLTSQRCWQCVIDEAWAPFPAPNIEALVA